MVYKKKDRIYTGEKLTPFKNKEQILLWLPRWQIERIRNAANSSRFVEGILNLALSDYNPLNPKK